MHDLLRLWLLFTRPGRHPCQVRALPEHTHTPSVIATQALSSQAGLGARSVPAVCVCVPYAISILSLSMGHLVPSTLRAHTHIDIASMQCRWMGTRGEDNGQCARRTMCSLGPSQGARSLSLSLPRALPRRVLAVRAPICSTLTCLTWTKSARSLGY